MKHVKKFRSTALTREAAQVAFGMHAVALAAVGRINAIHANVMLSPFVLGSAILEGVLKGLAKTDDKVLDAKLLEKTEGELELELQQQNPEAFKQLQDEITDAFKIQAKRFEKALSNIANNDRSNDFLTIIKRDSLALERLGKDYLLRSPHGELFKKAIGAMNACINGMSAASSVYLINMSRVGQFIGYSIGKKINSYGYSHEQSHNLVATLYAFSYILEECHSISKALLKTLFSDVITPIYAGALEGALAPSEAQVKALEDISLKVDFNDIKEFASLAWEDFAIAYKAAQKKFAKYDKALEEKGMLGVFALNPLKAEDERTLRGKEALLTSKKYKPVASALTTAKSLTYAGKAVLAKGAHGASRAAAKTAVGAVLKAREKLQSKHREK